MKKFIILLSVLFATALTQGLNQCFSQNLSNNYSSDDQKTRADTVTIATGRIEFRLEPSSDIFTIPCEYNNDPGKQHDSINRAVIMIHGVNRNAVTYYNHTKEAAQLAGNTLDSTMILAPQFLIEKDTANHLTNDLLYWSWGSHWVKGYFAGNPDPGNTLSSFAAMDTILNRLTDGRNRNLKDIVIAGHSAGGQFVNRYAAGCRMVETVKNRGITLRFVVANPSSYLYLDSLRYDSIADDWVVPAGCTTYNSYLFGLDSIKAYYMQSSNGNGKDNIRKNYRTRRVIYLLGEEDNDPNHQYLDKSCEAMTQGHHRYIRGLRYCTHLANFYKNRGGKHIS